MTNEKLIYDPKHYTGGKIEIWDFIADQNLSFDSGNAVKYICRAGKKEGETEEQDILKAINYLNHRLKIITGKKFKNQELTKDNIIVKELGAFD